MYAKSGDTEFNTGKEVHLKSHESAVYILDEFDINEKLRLNFIEGALEPLLAQLAVHHIDLVLSDRPVLVVLRDGSCTACSADEDKGLADPALLSLVRLCRCGVSTIT